MFRYTVGQVGLGTVNSFSTAALPLFMGTYLIPNWAIGVMAQERSLVSTFVQPLIGRLSDRLPASSLGRRRPFLLIGIPLTALALISLATYPPLAMMLALVLVFSVASDLAQDPYQALMVDITPSEQRPRVGAVQLAFGLVGQALTVIAAFALWKDHQPLAFAFPAVLVLLAFSITFFGIKEPDSPARPRGPRPAFLSRSYLRDIWGRRELVKFLSAMFFIWFGQGGGIPFMTRFGVEDLGLPANQSFTLLLPLLVFGVLASLAAGRLAARFGYKPVMAVGLGFAIVSLLAASTVVHTYPQVLAVNTFIGISGGLIFAPVFPLFSELIPAERVGELTGVATPIWSLAQPVGALFAGLVADQIGSIRGALAVVAVAFILGLALLLTLRPVRAAAREP